MVHPSESPVRAGAGVVLAGGRSARMGGRNKALMPLAGRTVIDHVIARFADQVDHMIISANENAAELQAHAFPVVADTIPGFAGPLAGILAGMLWAKGNAPEASHLVTAAADAPFVPRDLAKRLVTAIDREGEIAVAASNGRLQPVFGVWPVTLAARLEEWLASGQSRAVHTWVEKHPHRVVVFEGAVDPFFNINTPADLAVAEELLAAA